MNSLEKDLIKSDKIKQKVIVIDDEQITRKLIKHGLEKYYDVYIISNVTEAIKICELEHPDLILLDIIMPNIDGFEMLQLLKHHATLCEIPVICMSATDSGEQRTRVRDSGASGFIKKPINIKSLKQDIDVILESINSAFISKTGRINFLITYNDVEKEKKIKELLSSLKEGHKIIYLSWTRGDDYLASHPDLRPFLDDETLVYLEIKPSTITKFPYLQDITPIVHDIDLFMNKNVREYHLIFEEPRHLLNLADKEKTFSKIYNLGAIINNHFPKVTYVNTRPSLEEEYMILLKVGKTIINIRA